VNFKEFEQKFQMEKIPNQYGYETEKDYLEWEGLESRLKKYHSLLEVKNTKGFKPNEIKRGLNLI
jgi:hypothetical protein